MAYDYSQRFLLQHSDTVQKLLDVAKNGELLVYSGEFKEVSKRQYLVNNLLNSIARNLPEHRDIRTAVRCWTSYNDSNEYTLYIGVPQHVVGGRPPGMPRKMPWMANYIPAGSVGMIVYVHPNPIDSEQELANFVGHVVSQSAQCKRCEAKVAELSDVAVGEYFAPIFEPYGWSVRGEQDLLILERK